MFLICVPGNLCPPESFDALPVEKYVYEWMRQNPVPSLQEAASELLKVAMLHDDVVLVGHSTGGLICMQAALLDLKGTIKGMVLVNTGANTNGHKDIRSHVKELSSQPITDAFIDQYIAARVQNIESIGTDIVVAFRDYYKSLCEPNIRAAKMLQSQVNTDLIPELNKIKFPTLIIHGSLDKVRQVRFAEEIHRCISNSRLKTLPCGHCPNIEMPDEFAQEVLEFVLELGLGGVM
ncbi:hypothetical protein KL905_003723 [Ogataea polymorpha]|uniref:AB hydrolase-1 domain-containing protein n=1 Tax=Ogataea polymorpha TaxID=460523 RepID=A0A9P8SZW7_9ASCO|nr:hypothetical protein KL908_003549 [Ogataea polymorpha]KAG7899202.1 hypothetical protein KL935_003512 [Ogataea polymorpha]KAG7904416.1 hypothetical protein KL907_003292 [Ogataea polymorpha]KAG7919858.1 hypothetical protein KL905_003723 [Ogataea polymorpha]KAH3659961.1 hypothetical protein OGATHE_006006 [Ogataea polymorpha]